ncbi:unnamed protein product [Ectocarpus sp. 12 AP-2014]
MRISNLLLFAVSPRGFFLSGTPPAHYSSTIWKRHGGREKNSPLLLLQLPPSPRASSDIAAVEMAAATASRRLGKILPSSTVFFACDVQERFRDLIHNMPAVISTAKFMLDVSQELEVPCIVTEQYPKALLHTVPELNVGKGPDQINVPIFEKKLFSMCTKEVEEELKKLPDRKDAVLFGIEAHVCVTQTCLDLLDLGYEVHVVCDGVSSQKPHDRAVALQRMQQSGAFLTSAEQVTFQLLHTAENEKFRTVSNLVKKRNAEGINTFSTMSTL